MDWLINTRLLTLPNILAIGVIALATRFVFAKAVNALDGAQSSNSTLT